MRILKSQSQLELFVVLTDTETLLYSEVFHRKLALKIPELDNKKYVVLRIDPQREEGMPENSWHLVVKQEKATRTTGQTTPNALENTPSKKRTTTNKL